MTQAPFEQHGGTSTLAQEAAYLSELEAASGGRLAVDEVGTSVNGTPIRLLRVGYPLAPTVSNPGGGSMLVVAQQHGEEVTSREGMLVWVRDLVETTDPDLLAYLTEHPIYIMPTCNPDNLGVVYHNANGVNLNRDHFKLSQPETIAIHTVLRAYRPQVVLDMHTGGLNDVDLQGAFAAQVDPGIKSLSLNLRDSVIAHLEANGVRAGIYPAESSPTKSEPRMLRDAGGLLGHISLLSELRSGTGRPDVDATYAQHVAWSRATAEGVRLWHAEHVAECATTIGEADARAIEAGRASSTPFSLGQAGGVIQLPPREYWLRPAEYEAQETKFQLLGIMTTADGPWVKVSLAQPAYSVIPYVLDPDSTEATIKGRRWGQQQLPHGTRIDGAVLRVGKRDYPVRAMGVQVAGAMRIVWTNL